jgi:hypothetical protein
MLPSKVAGSSAISSNLFLVPRLADPKVPTPVDYLAFCNAAQASACIYLPPNTTFLIPQGPPDPTGAHALDGIGNQATGVDADTYVWDVDPMITDAGVCSSLGGRLTQDNACYFAYFSFQETTYKPAGKPSSAVSCGGDLYYWFFPNQGRIEALYNLPLTLGLSTISTGATPATCVVQVWLYP